MEEDIDYPENKKEPSEEDLESIEPEDDADEMEEDFYDEESA